MKPIGRPDCIFCGGGKPTDVYQEEEGDLYHFRCERCGEYVGRLILAEHDYARVLRSPSFPEQPENIPERTDFHTWEVLIVNDRMVQRLHGRYVSGDKKLLPLLDFYSEEING